MDMFFLGLKSLGETLCMVCGGGFLSILLGVPLGITLYIISPQSQCSSPRMYALLGAIVNAFRSIPYIILMILLFPFVRILIGTSIGTSASILPLGLCAGLLVVRATEDALMTVTSDRLDIGKSLGGTMMANILYIVIPEALPLWIRSFTTIVINIIGFSAMAGAIGGGGLGDLAIRYGYQRYDMPLMIAIVVVLMVLVQLVQSLGNWLSQR